MSEEKVKDDLYQRVEEHLQELLEKERMSRCPFLHQGNLLQVIP